MVGRLIDRIDTYYTYIMHGSNNFSECKLLILFIFIEILKNVSQDWKNIFVRVAITLTDKKNGRKNYKYVYGSDIRWPIAEEYPSCQPLDLFDYSRMDALTPQSMTFLFGFGFNARLTLHIEDRNAVTSRSIIYQILALPAAPSLIHLDS